MLIGIPGRRAHLRFAVESVGASGKKLGAEAGGVRKLSVATSAAAEMSFSSMRRTSKPGPVGGSGNTSPQAQRGVLDVVQQRA